MTMFSLIAVNSVSLLYFFIFFFFLMSWYFPCLIKMQLKNVGVIVVILVPRQNTLTDQREERKEQFLSSFTHSRSLSLSLAHTHKHMHTYTHSSLWFISDCAINALKTTLYVVLAVSIKTLWVFFISCFIQSPGICFYLFLVFVWSDG